MHHKPAFGSMRLDQINFAAIQDFIAEELASGLSKKSVNNYLTVLRRSLVVAKKRDLIPSVPEIEWLRAPKPEFDSLHFEEAERLVKAADGEWKTLILVALRTGMRHGELLALRWEDVDLVKGQIHVRRSVTRDVITEPKSNRARIIRSARRRGAPQGTLASPRRARVLQPMPAGCSGRTSRRIRSGVRARDQGCAGLDGIACATRSPPTSSCAAFRSRRCRSCSATRRSR